MTETTPTIPPSNAVQLARSAELAIAFARYDAAMAEAEKARIALDEAFFPWAAGRATSRDEARAQLVAVGFLPAPRECVCGAQGQG